MQVMQDVIDCLGGTLAGLTITSFVAPLVVVVFAPIGVAFELIRRRYIATSRELKRLDSLALSPVLSSLTETLQASDQDIFKCVRFCCLCHAASTGSTAFGVASPQPGGGSLRLGDHPFDICPSCSLA